MRSRSFIVAAILILVSLPITPVQASGILPIWEPCEKKESAPCIESFSLIDQSGQIFPGKLSGRTRETSFYFAGVTFSGIDYEWDVPDISQPSGQTTFNISGEYFPLNTPYCWLGPNQPINECDHGVDEIRLAVSPSDWVVQAPPIHFPKLGSDRICGDPSNPSTCSTSWNLNDTYTYQITLRIASSFVPAMMVGQGVTGGVKTVKNLDGSLDLSVSGIPTTQVLGVNYSPVQPDQGNPLSVFESTALSFFIQSQNSTQAQWTNICNRGSLLSYWHDTGIGTIPVWVAKDQSIEMQTAGIHLKPDGSLNEGLIELQIPVAMAQCLWGVDLSRAIMATVSISYDDQSIPTVISTRTKIVDDYFVLTSKGFHYSTPLVKIKLSQDTVPQTSPTPTPSPTPTSLPTIVSTPSPGAKSPVVIAKVPKPSTITCYKGKLIKKVTAVNPKCPAGYSLRK